MNHCIVCQAGPDTFRPFWPQLQRCVACGHCVADLDPQSVNPKAIYSDEYFTGEEYAEYAGDRAVFEQQFRDRLQTIRQFQADGDLIEIGCAYGFFLGVAQDHFRVRGFDIAEGPVQYARDVIGVDARCEDFVEAPVEDNSADVVVMWDAIEHLPRPDLMVAKIARVLRPGGHFFLTTGDIGSVLARMQRGRWRMIHPPTHLHYFDRSTIVALLERLGIHAVQTRYVGVRRSVRQIAFGLLVLGKGRSSPFYERIARSRFGTLSVDLNTRDIMLVVGQKAPAGVSVENIDSIEDQGSDLRTPQPGVAASS